MNKIKKIIDGLIVYGAFLAIILPLLNLLISINYYRFTHPKETETELFLHIPKAFIWRQ